MSDSSRDSAARAELLYIADPMCSWCFAFAPILASVRANLRDDVNVRYVLGGLAQDSDEPMDDETKSYVQGAWRSIEARTNARFNWDYWEHCTPRRSTWPACRAVLVAGERGLSEEMFHAIQRAYYQEARDPSDLAELAKIASELGFDREEFAGAIQSDEARARLFEEFDLRNEVGARSFPSLGLRRGSETKLLTSGWAEEQDLRTVLSRDGLLQGS